jgi:predicted ATP-binding protein involved in virulence
MEYENMKAMYESNRLEEIKLLERKSKQISTTIRTFDIKNKDDQLILAQLEKQQNIILKRIIYLKKFNVSSIEELKRMLKPVRKRIKTNTGKHKVVFENVDSYISEKGYVISKEEVL